MNKYYCLVASLPELTLEDSKLNYTVASFKEYLDASLSVSDRKLAGLFYLQFDNKNVLKLLANKEAVIDVRGNYSSEELFEYISLAKEEGAVAPELFPSYLSTFIFEYYNGFESGGRDGVSQEDHLSALYYEYGMNCGNAFVAS
ncbi:hypothetical protein EZS27_041602, partial [termite gut metagenome]